MSKQTDFLVPAQMSHEVNFRGTRFLVIDALVSRTPHWLFREFQDLPDFAGLNIKTMLDIGANTGMFSFYMKSVYPELKITAIEAAPQNMKHFHVGCVLNGFQIETICAAVVGQDNAGDPFYFDVTQSGCAKLKYHQGEPEIRVDRVLLDNVFDRPYDFVKCDIEGAEFDVFQSFTKWDMINSLFIELHPFPRETAPQKQKELYDSFSAFLREKMAGKPVWIPHPGGF